MHANDLQFDLWPSPNRPPCGIGHFEFSRVRFVNPIRLQPVKHVVMAGDGHEFLPAPPDRLGDCCTANLSDRSIHYRRELVYHSQGWHLGQRPGHIDSELLAVAEHVEWAHPRWRRRESDRREQAGDIPDSHRFREAVQNASIGWPVPARNKFLTECLFRQRRFAGTTRTHDDTDIPRIRQRELMMP